MLKPTRPTGFRSALLTCLLSAAAFLNAACASAVTPIYEHKEGELPSVRFMLPGEIPLELVTLPAGSIAMQVNRKPAANEGVDKDGRVVYKFGENELSVGKFEVTQAQWQAVMKTTQKELSEAARPGGNLYGIGPNFPVYDVSAEQAKEFCARLNKTLPSSFRYRFTLPDEAEWEYACRAGTTTELNSGRELRARNNVSMALNEIAWYRGNSLVPVPTVSEAGRKTPNAWGLYDMHGNVQELCLDWFMRDFTAAYKGDLCAMRGGSWHASPEDCTVTACRPVDATVPVFDAGFRLALKPAAIIPKTPVQYEKTPLHQDHITGLVVLVKFPDDPENVIIPKEKVEFFLNETNYRGYGNSCSIHDFVDNQSCGRCDLKYKVSDYVVADHERDYYQKALNYRGADMLIKEAMSKLPKDFDLSTISKEPDGTIRSACVLYSRNSSFDGLWPQAHWFTPMDQIRLPGGLHSMQVLICGIQDSPTVSILIHEIMHQTFDILDYVDYGEKSNKTPKNEQKVSHGLGNHCIMGIGMYDRITGLQTNPTALAGPFRYRLGWLKALPLPSKGKVRIPASSEYGYIYRNPSNPDEYFLLENRNADTSFYRALPSHGLAIWHVDDAVTDQEEDEEMTLEKHYEISLEQAGGVPLLEKPCPGTFGHQTHGRDCNGIATDYFYPPDRVVFNDTSKPDSLWWDGSPSGLDISNIEVDGRDLILTIGPDPKNPRPRMQPQTQAQQQTQQQPQAQPQNPLRSGRRQGQQPAQGQGQGQGFGFGPGRNNGYNGRMPGFGRNNGARQ
ncbi:MAG: SUMF1/EgtB/PvdO family nonheme iron enzyme [Lentisphaeria bacterium]|nr:SUMF1/EgtB/PvdO family nonheme iron enzyme [Lentisphaeria bacterium]